MIFVPVHASHGIIGAEMSTIYCPNCGYNLTGLPENRCPECSLPFNPAQLEYSMSILPKTITTTETMLRLSWPPAIFLASVAVAWMIPQLGVLLILTGIFLLVYGLVNARQLAARLAVTRAYQQGRSSSEADSRFIRLCGGGLWFCQLFIGLAGCAVCTTQSLW